MDTARLSRFLRHERADLMTNAEAIKTAVAIGNARLAGKWVDKMRAAGATYDTCRDRAIKLTGCTAEEFEGLMQDADESGGG